MVKKLSRAKIGADKASGCRVTGRAKTGQRGALKTGQCFDVASYTSFDVVPANFS
jgi:hypothetical protein